MHASRPGGLSAQSGMAVPLNKYEIRGGLDEQGATACDNFETESQERKTSWKSNGHRNHRKGKCRSKRTRKNYRDSTATW